VIQQPKQLYLFLTACGGNWRNSVFISCCEEHIPGWLLVADWNGQPVIMSIQQFYQMTGVWIDPAECCGQLTEAGFETIYTQYLLWRCPSVKEHPLRELCKGAANT